MPADPKFFTFPTVRSLTSTITLAIAAFLAVTLVVILVVRGNLNQFFGAPPTAIGSPMYTGFTAKDISQIALSGNGAKARFRKENGIWMMIDPIRDRMDPRAAKLLIDFTLGTRAADVFPNEKIDFTQAGLRDGMVQIKLSDDQGKAKARYTLGRRTAWTILEKENSPVTPTVFLQPSDLGRKTHTYACTGDIGPMFKDGLRFLRDHQPFLFMPTQLEKIHIRNAKSEFTIEGYGQEKPWRITKPLKLATETSEMKNFIENGLFNLRASRVLDRSEVPITAGTTQPETSITLQMRGLPAVTLDIFPPNESDTNTCYAIVSDRPETVFLLPLRSQDLISLSSLPIHNYNEIRSRNLTFFNHKNLKIIDIHPRNLPPIEVFRLPMSQWRLRTGEKTSEFPNEKCLYEFLKSITTCKVTNFLTDNAFQANSPQDAVTYGLDQPVCSLYFTFQDNSRQKLSIGLTKEGIYTAHLDHPETRHTVYQIPEEFVSSLPLYFKQWKDTRLLSIPAMDFSGLHRTRSGKPDLLLQYIDNPQKWTASVHGKDQTSQLNSARANKILETLGNIQVVSWINDGNTDAETALLTPAITLAITSFSLNEFGERDAPKTQTLELAPAGTNNQKSFYYGRLSTCPDLFYLDYQTVAMLALDVFSESNP